MNDLSQQLGYVLAKLEEIRADLEKVDSRLSTLEDKVTDKFKTAELAIKWLRFLGLAAIAVLTFQFGDVSRLWVHIFG